MTAKIIDGLAIANLICADIKYKVAKIKHTKPGLAVVLVGDDLASNIYVNNKCKKTKAVGMLSVKHQLPASCSQQRLTDLIVSLNQDDSIHGILVQLPLPKHIDSLAVLDNIHPNKDVDGFHVYNVGRLSKQLNCHIPCTAQGCLHLIRSVSEISGKKAVVIGRSHIVGRPTAELLLQNSATVTIAHSKTKNLPEICSTADILVSAVGQPKLITQDCVKPGSVVIDVGIIRLDAPSAPKGYVLQGDVDFDNVRHKAMAITPVPGGVGPMTIAYLLQNTLNAALGI